MSRIVVKPVSLCGRVYRIVAPVPSLLEVEVWVSEWWEPSTATITDVSNAMPATAEILAMHGVPPEPAAGEEHTASAKEIQSMLRAPERPAPPPEGQLEETVAPLTRRPRYPGSARFHRGARKSADHPPPKVGKRGGPFRRSSDQRADDGPATPSRAG